MLIKAKFQFRLQIRTQQPYLQQSYFLQLHHIFNIPMFPSGKIQKVDKNEYKDEAQPSIQPEGNEANQQEKRNHGVSTAST